MSDVTVVALVPVAGRPGQDELIAAAIRRLTGFVSHVIVLADTDIPTAATVVSGTSLAEHAVTVASRPGVRVVLVHDPLRAHTPADLVTRVVDEVLRTGRPVVPVLPCSVVIDTPDRTALRVLQSPIGYPAELIASGAVVAGTVPVHARTVAGDPQARRLATAVDIAMINGGQE
jgi:2-C-methyl-D-erythritol 4-phosphate cytidylyltransferase